MGRVKTIETNVQSGIAIQFVRTAIGEVYEFNEMRDMTVSFKNDKFSGSLMDDTGRMVPLTGKDWLVKSPEGHITVYRPEDFEKTFRVTGDK